MKASGHTMSLGQLNLEIVDMARKLLIAVTPEFLCEKWKSTLIFMASFV